MYISCECLARINIGLQAHLDLQAVARIHFISEELNFIAKILKGVKINAVAIDCGVLQIPKMSRNI